MSIYFEPAMVVISTESRVRSDTQLGKVIGISGPSTKESIECVVESRLAEVLGAVK